MIKILYFKINARFNRFIHIRTPQCQHRQLTYHKSISQNGNLYPRLLN